MAASRKVGESGTRGAWNLQSIHCASMGEVNSMNSKRDLNPTTLEISYPDQSPTSKLRSKDGEHAHIHNVNVGLLHGR